MRHNTLNDAERAYFVTTQALAEVMTLAADGLSIDEAMSIGKATERHLKALERTREWVKALRSGVTIS